MSERFEARRSKDRQCNDQKKKRTNNDIRNTTQQTKIWATRTLLRPTGVGVFEHFNNSKTGAISGAHEFTLWGLWFFVFSFLCSILRTIVCVFVHCVHCVICPLIYGFGFLIDSQISEWLHWSEWLGRNRFVFGVNSQFLVFFLSGVPVTRSL